MSPNEFINRWKSNSTSERSGAQSHFNDLCELLGVDKPNDNPMLQDSYCFERGAKRTGAGHGWADVWKRGCFAWEYKKPNSNLSAALKQLMTYALALENPPLLVVSDRLSIQIHTHFTGHPSEVHTIDIQSIGTPENLQKLKWIFQNPDKFKPSTTTAALTQEAAMLFGELARTMQERGHDPRQVAHFLNKILFCLFAEDAQAPGQDPLLQDDLFSKILRNGLKDNERFQRQLSSLFKAMSHQNGEFGEHMIEWFNGGLFDDDVTFPLMPEDIQKLTNISMLDWSQIEPSIFGTLFERGLNPKKRSQLGAHYTDADSIMRIVRPVIIDPLTAEWNNIHEDISRLMGIVHDFETSRKPSEKAKATKAFKEAHSLFIGFLEKLKGFKVLDPACGSGNFLYMALQSLKDLELKANLDAETLGLERAMPQVGPESIFGIELDPYAAELARVTVWIGEIQWMLKHGFAPSRNPILKSLYQIQCRDALLTITHEGYVEAEWPQVDVIVGNPPFLGGSKKRRELGDDTFEALSKIYDGRVPPGADLVCYWFDKANIAIENGCALRAGLVSTNSIRGGSNRHVLDEVVSRQEIFNAWSDEPWINEGAAVRVSIVNFASKNAKLNEHILLDGEEVKLIHADLTPQRNDATGVDITKAKILRENLDVCFMGSSKKGSFDIPGELARSWLNDPNPSGRPNSDVLRPVANGMEITRRPADMWIIDYGTTMTEKEAELYLAPFEYVVENVKPDRLKNNRESYRKYWWRHAEARPSMRAKLSPLCRYIATPAVSKHRVFVWLDAAVLPDQAVLAFAREDDTTFGVLHSRFHEVWSLSLCSSLEDRPRYTPSTCFETFPFPSGLELDCTSPEDDISLQANAIAVAAKTLNETRERWLNPAEWSQAISQDGYPDRIVPIEKYEAELKKRTLTNLYNLFAEGKASWLATLHKDLDIAVAAAYGWSDYTPDMSDDEILRRLLHLNQERVS